MNSLTFCIFSYNRGEFLKNCVESIEHCVKNANIYIFDDDSDDEDTQRYLSDVKSRHTVLSKTIDMQESKHGGLYGNMQYALTVLSEEKMLCFLQDDMQIVRPLLQEEIDQLYTIFEEHEDVGFIHPCFIKGVDTKKNGFNISHKVEEDFFLREDTGRSAGIHYSDICIFSPQRLLTKNWHFSFSEPGNDKAARIAFGRMLYMFKPFAMWLPNVPAYRGKKKTWALRIAEGIESCGFYPYRIWDLQRSHSYINTAMNGISVAEDYLQCGISKKEVWNYGALYSRRIFKVMNKIEIWFRKKL